MSRTSLSPRCLFGAMILIAMFNGPADASASESPLHEGGFRSGDLNWERLDDGSFRLDLPGSRPLAVTGAPDLPAIDLLLLVPAHQAISGVRIEPLAVGQAALPGDLADASPLRTSTGEEIVHRPIDPDGPVFPPTWGLFGGVHSWRGYRLLAVTIHPVRVVAGDQGTGPRLEYLERFAVHAVAGQGASPSPLIERERQVAGERERLERTLRRMVANPQAVPSYRRTEGARLDKQGSPHLPTPNPSLEGSGVRYLIVTTEEFADEFQRLADHRTAQGLPAKVVTREWIAATHRQGIDFQETLRMYLQEAYAKWGIEYLLLGGDTEFIPTRHIRNTFYPQPDGTIIPTDLYYAGLDGNWNADGDGWLGEPATLEGPVDEADLAPELSVGRATVRTTLGVQQFVDKVLTYEATAVGASYANNILYAAEVLFPTPWEPGMNITIDGAQFAHELNETYTQPHTDMTALRMYQSDREVYPRDTALSLAAFIAALDSGSYGQVNQFGHGHFFNMSMGDANFVVSDADALTNAPNFFLLFTLNCASAAFDYSCLLERFVENPDGGSIVSIGSAREAFPMNASEYQEAFYEAMMADGALRVGDALNASRLQLIGFTGTNSVYRWTTLNVALLGDPAINIWNGSPQAPQIAAPAQVDAGEQTVPITVSAAGAPVAGADVCLAKAGETYARGVTDVGGNVWLDVIPQTSGPLTLTVCGAGLAQTSQTIAVQGAAAYVSLDDIVVSDTTGNGNGLPEAGETLSLYLTLRDVGGAGATGLTVTVTSDDPDLAIIDGTAAAGDIPPGGTVALTDPIVVQAPASMRDGSSVDLSVAVDGAGGSWQSRGALEILAPEPEIVRLLLDDAVHGNGNGLPEDGERLVLRPYVKNFGAGDLDQLLIQIVDAAPGVTVHQDMALMLGLGSLAEGTYLSGELSLTLDDVNMLAPARLVCTDNYGRSFDQPLEYNPPTAPPALQTDATQASDAIILRWEPVGGARTLGYHVYRAEDAGGPFVRANQDLLRGTAYFDDRPLQQLTPYWYKVTAVDTFMIEGAESSVVEQGTMPAELANFPLTFKSMTSSHAAVGDVTGDGRPEIVLAADELYVWRNDGTEVRDGDEDSQTTGPFTGLGGAFSPAGVVLADVDGRAGNEILASLLEPSRQIHAYKADGTQLPGWPRSLLSHWNWATPAVGDVDGDGFNEVVVNDLAGRTFVWRRDGTELRDGDGNPATDGVFVARPESWGYSSPALYDLDGDGAREIIFGTYYNDDTNGLLAYKADGSQAPGFPFATGMQRIICSPAIADLDGDGAKEIIFFTTGRRLYVLRADGSVYPGFPRYHSGSYDHGAGPSPAVGNFDDDPDLEIVWPLNGNAAGMEILLVDTGLHDGTAGTIMDGWPIQLSGRTEGSPVVGDINGDGRVDIVQPTEDNYLYAFEADGAVIAGFPIRLSGPCRTTPVICDLDGDGEVNLVYGSGDLLLHVWSMPYAYDPALVPYPTFQGNNRRTGEAQIVSPTSVDDPRVPTVFTVLPPYPNPFNPITKLRLYVAPETDPALDVAVFDLRGRKVRQLHSGAVEPGWRELTWDGSDDQGRRLGSGVYFVKARQGARSQTFKLALVK